MSGRKWLAGAVAVATGLLSMGVSRQASADPVPLGGPFLITGVPADAFYLQNLDGAYDSKRNQFMLVMMTTGPQTRMTARIVRADGTAVSGVLPIPAVENTWGNTVDEGIMKSDHDVVYNATTDQYFLTWSQSTGPNSQGVNGARWNTVYGQRFSASTGAPIGNAVRLNTLRGNTAFCSVRYPKVAYNPADGGYVMVWQHVFFNGQGVSAQCPGLPAGAAFQLELTRISSAGTPVGAPTVIPGSTETASDIQPYIKIVRHSTGRFLVSFRVRVPSDTSKQRVILRNVSSAGALSGGPVQIEDGGQKAGAWAAERPDGNWLILSYVGGGKVKADVYTSSLARVGQRTDVAASGVQSPVGVAEFVALGDGTYAMLDVDGRALFHLGPDAVPKGAPVLPAALDRILPGKPGSPVLVAGSGWSGRLPAGPLRYAMVGQRVTFGVGPAQIGGGRVGPNGRLCFTVAGSPGDVALVNLTPVGATSRGNGQLVSSNVTNPPVASNVNYGPGTVDPNVAATPIGNDGKVCYVNSNTSVHLIADHLGTINKSAIKLATPTGAPARRTDTRIGLGGGRIGPNGRLCFTVAGSPGDVALVNLTPVGATSRGNGQLVSSNVTNPPVASNVNYGPGTVDPNVAATPIGNDGKVCYVNSNTSVHLIADHLGTINKSAIKLATPTGAPARRTDTRIGLGGGRVGPNGRLCFTVAGSPGDVALVNLTPVGATSRGNGQLVSSNVTNPPVASNVNYGPGTVDPNVAATPIGNDGKVCYVNSNTSVHLIADHLGTINKSAIKLATPTGAPSRRVDTR